MANLNKGTTFVSGGEVTAAKLNDMVDNATITDITATDLASNNAMVTIGTAPANKAGNLYFDNGSNSTFGAKNGELLVYSGGMFHSAAENVETVMTFLSTESPVVGSVMTLDTTTNDQVKMSSVANDTSVVGVVAETSSTKARVVRTGYAKVKCNASLTDANRGNYLVASATAGQATTASVIEAGTFGRIMSIDLSDDTIAYAMIFPATQPSGTAYPVSFSNTTHRSSQLSITASNGTASDVTADSFTISGVPLAQPYVIDLSGFVEVSDTLSGVDVENIRLKEGSTTIGTLVPGSVFGFTTTGQPKTSAVYPFSGSIYVDNAVTTDRTFDLVVDEVEVTPGSIGTMNYFLTTNVNAVQWKVV